MNLRWLWRDYFPHGVSLSRQEKAAVLRRAREMQRSDPAATRAEARFDNAFRPLAWIGLGAIGIGGWYGGVALWTTSGLFAAFLLACNVVSALAHYRLRGLFIRRALHHYGHEVCIDCGYLLRGLDDAAERCPECGAERDRELMRVARESYLPEARTRRDDRPPRWERAPWV